MNQFWKQSIGILTTILIFTMCTSPKTESTDKDSTGVGESVAESAKDTVAEEAPSKDYGSSIELKKYLVSENGISPDEIQVIDSTCAISIWPTDQQIEKMQNEMDDDEYNTIVDDNSYYLGEAINRIDSLQLKIVLAKKRYLKLKGTQATWFLDIRSDSVPEWNLIFFNVNKEPQIADQVDVAVNPKAKAILRQYFDLK